MPEQLVGWPDFYLLPSMLCQHPNSVRSVSALTDRRHGAFRCLGCGASWGWIEYPDPLGVFQSA